MQVVRFLWPFCEITFIYKKDIQEQNEDHKQFPEQTLRILLSSLMKNNNILQSVSHEVLGGPGLKHTKAFSSNEYILPPAVQLTPRQSSDFNSKGSVPPNHKELHFLTQPNWYQAMQTGLALSAIPVTVEVNGVLFVQLYKRKI